MIGVIQIVFILLKLVKVIDWSWWTVFIPCWIDLALAVILLSSIGGFLKNFKKLCPKLLTNRKKYAIV